MSASVSPIECSTVTGKAWLVPIDALKAPESLAAYLATVFNNEVDAGDTYPHNVHMNNEEFKHYWFGYKVILLLRDEPELTFDRDWETDLLGTYYIKPNYLGHCAHICNAGFLVPISQRRNKYGKVLARSFPHFASRLGYRSSVFNLVFESNLASMRLWDQYGYKRVGRIEEAINVKGKWVAAIVYQGNFLDGSIQTIFDDKV